jgi:hypothetical protein
MTPIRMRWTSSGPNSMPADSRNHDNSGLFTLVPRRGFPGTHYPGKERIDSEDRAVNNEESRAGPQVIVV